MARHASDLELLRFEDSFDGEIRLDEPLPSIRAIASAALRAPISS